MEWDLVRSDPVGAFCDYSDATLEGASAGPLVGLTFAAKDLLDVVGHVTGGGNPDWLATHSPAEETAWTVQALVDAGASMVGKTHCDEISRGVFGENRHYGTPINVRAPDRVPGGSSSGSAAAVAGGLVDFALGTDTAGSVRIPASFCGLYGIRPTHGGVSMNGVLPQAPSYDTVGWFARDAEMFARVGEVLLQGEIAPTRPKRMVIAEDAFAFADADVAAALRPIAQGLAELVGEHDSRPICPTDLADWRGYQAVLQRREAWRTFADWIDQVNPRFGFDVAELFASGARTDEDEHRRAERAQPEIVAIIDDVLAGGTVICLPTTPCVAPLRGQLRSAARRVLMNLLSLTCIAGLAGVPQISLPLAEIRGVPVGLSLIGARGTDEMLIGFARAAADADGSTTGNLREHAS